MGNVCDLVQKCESFAHHKLPLYGINHSLFKFFNDAFMNAITEIFNGVLSIGQHHRGSVVWQLTFWLCVTTVNIRGGPIPVSVLVSVPIPAIIGSIGIGNLT